jgi:Na+-driven multidrug efflux pump
MEQQKSKEMNMLTDSIWSLLAKQAGPAVAGMLVMSFYQIVDGIMVGRRLGAEALAAINILYPVIALLVGLAVMIGSGGIAKIAVLQGSGNIQEARKTLGLITIIGVGIGAVGSIALEFLTEPILRILMDSEELTVPATTYMRAMGPFVTAFILMYILDMAVRNDGKPHFATGVMITSAILNIVLDYLFLFVLNWGIESAALASGISQSFGTLLFLGYFWRNSRVIKAHADTSLLLGFGSPFGVGQSLGAIMVNGSSEFFTSLALGVTTWLFNLRLLDFGGSRAVAAYALIQYILMVAMIVFQGTAMGAQPLFGQNYGAGNIRRVKEVLKKLLILNGVASSLVVALAWIFMQPAIQAFVPQDQATVSLTLEAGRIVIWSAILMPLGIIGSVFFTSLEKAGTSLLIASVRGLVLPLAGLLVLPNMLGLVGIWLVPVVVEAGAGMLVLTLMFHWKNNFQIIQTQEISNQMLGSLESTEMIHEIGSSPETMTAVATE